MYEKSLQYALRIIAKKRYTTFEITKKLKLFLEKQERLAIEKNVNDNDQEIIPKVLERLHELKYLDDKSYAADYVADRIKFRPRGKFLLSRELKNKGLDSDLIQNALEKQNVNEFETAVTALEKKSRQWENLPLQKQRERAFRFLSSRGFEQDAIYKAVNSRYNQHAK